MPDLPSGPDFDLLASSIRSDSGDLRTYLDVVAGKLADSLPGSVKVEREGGLFARQHRVNRVTLSLDGRAYALAWTGTDLQATIDGGPVPVDRWALALGRHLEDHAQAETQSRAAMEALLEGRLPAQVLGRPDPRPIVARHPVTSFSPDSVVDVGPSDTAVLVAAGGPAGPVGAGRHRVGDLLAAPDPAAKTFDATIYFVSALKRTNLRFGGVSGDLRVYGTADVRVADPVGLVTMLAGPAVGEITDEAIAGLTRDAVLKALAAIPEATGSELAERTLDQLKTARPPAVVEILDLPVLNVSRVEPAPPEVAISPGGCPRCGAQNVAGSRFCSQCGGPLPA